MLWERYPSIKAELLQPGQQDVGAGVQNGRRDDNLRGEGGVSAAAAAAAVDPGKKAEEKGTSFWMAFDDFTAEFSQARSRAVFSIETRNSWFSNQ